MKVINLGRVVGDDGKSSYQIWLEQGNTGTEEDFLNSLKAQGGEVENPYKGKYLSILGASTATFKGYVPTGYKVYYPKGDVTSVDDMYWKIVIDRLGMNLCVNNSYSGASISGTDAGDVIHSGRATKLHTDEQEPDVILVNSGLNDFNSNIEIGTYRGNGPVPTTYTTFADAYAYMLNQVINRYPNAEIWCATQPSGATSNFGEGNYAFPVTRAVDNVTLAEWNNVIKTIANAYGCRVIELGKCGFFPANYSDYFVDYNEDGKGKALHPNKAGFQLIADQFVRQMLAKAPGGDGYIDNNSSGENEDIDLSQIKQVTDVTELPTANAEEYNKAKIYRMKKDLMYISKDVEEGTGCSISELDTVLPEERAFSCCGVVGDYAYILGGASKNSTLTITNTAYKMNLKTNEITKLNDLPIKIAWAGCAVVGTDIYIIGGRVQELTGTSGVTGTKIYKYDTTNDTFTEMLDITGSPASHQSVASITVGTDIYTFGGNDADINVTKYDTLTNQITTLASQVSGRRMLIALAVYENYIYLLGGGTTTTADCVNIVEKFDITNDTITTLPITLPENRGRTSVAQFGDNVLLFGGSNGTGTTYKDIVVFNAKSETLSKADINLPTTLRGSMVAQISDSECYLIGGSTSSSYDTVVNTIYKFIYGEGALGYGFNNIAVLPKYPEFDENKSYILSLKPNADLTKYELVWIENIT